MKRTAASVALAVWVAACGGTAPSPTVSVDLEGIIGDAAVAMASIQSARFTMERSGAPIEISGMEFVSADGQFAAPGSARALLQVRAGDLSVELGTIGIGDTVWLTNPLTSAWEQLAPGTGFNPAVVFDPALGWVPLLTDDLADVNYRGIDETSDGPRHLIHGTIAERRIAFLTAGLVSAQSVEADLWIHPDSDRITRIAFETTGDDGVSSWLIELSDFDAPVVIEPPDMDG